MDGTRQTKVYKALRTNVNRLASFHRSSSHTRACAQACSNGRALATTEEKS